MKSIILTTVSCILVNLNTTYAKTDHAMITEYRASKKLGKNASDSLLRKIIPTIKFTAEGIEIPNYIGERRLIPDYYIGNKNPFDTLVFDKILYAVTNKQRIIVIGNLFGSKKSAVLNIPYSKDDTSFFAKEDNVVIDLNIHKRDSLLLYFLKTRYYTFGYQQVHLFGYVLNKRDFNFVTSITTPFNDEVLDAPDDNPHSVDLSKLDSDFHSQYIFSQSDWNLKVIRTYRNKSVVAENYRFDYKTMMFKKDE